MNKPHISYVATKISKRLNLSLLGQVFVLTLGRTPKFIPPPWYNRGKGGWNPSSRVYDMLQYFETILL